MKKLVLCAFVAAAMAMTACGHKAAEATETAADTTVCTEAVDSACCKANACCEGDTAACCKEAKECCKADSTCAAAQECCQADTAACCKEAKECCNK